MSQSTRRRFLQGSGTAAVLSLAGCARSTEADEPSDSGGDDGEMSTDEAPMVTPIDPESASRASIDRFSEDAGHLMVRSGENGLPGPDEPVDFDQRPFITTGLGPDGATVRYYDFDV